MPDTPLKLAALVAADLPPPTSPGWEAAMRALITRGHTAAWLAGMSERLGVPLDSPLLSRQRLSRAEREEIKALVEKQLQYLKGFIGDKADMSEAQIGARSSLYPGAVRATYYGARWGDWDVPQGLMPGMQQCITRCACRISITDNGDGTGILLREMGGIEHHCGECPPLAGEHPVKRRIEGKAQTDQERAMFANMGRSKGGAGYGPGGKPTGGQGGLWPKGKDGKRHGPGETAKPASGAIAPLNDAGIDPTAVPIRRFSDPAAADAYLREQMRVGNLSRAEIDALDFYQGGAFEMVNGYLRGNLPFDLSASERVLLDTHIANLNRVMRPLTDNVEVHRGLFVGDDTGRALLSAWQPGATFQDKSYISTTVDARIARRFSTSDSVYSNGPGQYAVDVRMRVPAGTPAIYYNAARPRGNPEERELLLGAGSSYRVVGRTELPGGKIVIDLEVLP